MNLETCLLTNYIYNNSVVSCCDFIPDHHNKGIIIYEVIRVINSTPLFYHNHVERFYNSVSSSRFSIDLSKRSITLRIKTLIEINKLVDGNIKFQINFTDNNQPNFSAWICPYYYPSKEMYTTGVKTVTISAQRNNPNIKVYNDKLKNITSSAITNNDVYEVLLVNNNGFITEGSRTNVFFVSGNIVFTPNASSILPGVTRQKVIEILLENDFTCKETDIHINSISKFKGAFLTGTSPKILPIVSINNNNFNPKHSSIKAIIDKYDRTVQKDINQFTWNMYD